jgi:hypothetical protein
MHTGRRVFILTKAQNCLNSHVPCVPLFFTSVSTLILKSSHKAMTVGAHHGAHEIKLCESNGVSIYNHVFFLAQGGFWDLFSL